MADYYLTFSEVIPTLTEQEEAWLDHQLEMIYVFGTEEYAEEKLPETLDRETADWHGCRNLRDLPGHDPYDTDVGFEYEFQGNRQDQTGWGRHLWFHAEYHADVERIGHLVQKFLRQFRPDTCWWLTYATTCSKLRIGEFGGGALFVTAKRVKWTNANEFVEREQMAFERRQVRTLNTRPKVGKAARRKRVRCNSPESQ